MKNSITFWLGNLPIKIILIPDATTEEKQDFLLNRIIFHTESFVRLLNDYNRREGLPCDFHFPRPQHYKKLVDLALKKGYCQLNRNWLGDGK